MKTYLGMNPIGHGRVLTDPIMKERHMDLLFSFAYKKEYELLKDFHNVDLMVDSGAFTINGQYPNFEKAEKHSREYMKFIVKTRKDPRIQYYFDLDLHTLLSYDQIHEIREKLFELTPNIIPIWHKRWGAKKFMEMCKEYDYVAIPCKLGMELEKFNPLCELCPQKSM